jgi:hypothetical protein
MKKILDEINKHSAQTINQLNAIPQAHLSRIISGGLRDTINSHGPITKTKIGSATKRIVGNLKEKLE